GTDLVDQVDGGGLGVGVVVIECGVELVNDAGDLLVVFLGPCGSDEVAPEGFVVELPLAGFQAGAGGGLGGDGLPGQERSAGGLASDVDDGGGDLVGVGVGPEKPVGADAGLPGSFPVEGVGPDEVEGLGELVGRGGGDIVADELEELGPVGSYRGV